MEQFLKKYKLPQLFQHKIVYLNSLITIKEIETEVSMPRRFNWEISKNLSRRINTESTLLLPENRRGVFFLIHFMKTDTKTRQRQHIKRENQKPTSLMNIDAKNLNKILVSIIQQYIKRIIHRDQGGLFQEYKTGSIFEKSINVDRIKRKNHVIISIKAE